MLLHIANSLLVFFVFRRMTGAQWRSAMVAGLFALHPLRVESVAWIAERKDVLSCFWFLVALWAYLRYVERPTDGRYRWVLAAMVMGLMSKPVLVTVPLLFLLVDYWPLGRVAFQEKVPMLFLAAVASVLTAIGQKRMGAMEWSAGIPVRMRVANAVVAYVRYLGEDRLAGEAGDILSLSGFDRGVEGGGRGVAAGVHHGGGAVGRTAVWVPGRGLAVVPGGAGSDDRTGAGGEAVDGGPLLLHSADRPVRRGGVGRRADFAGPPAGGCR